MLEHHISSFNPLFSGLTLKVRPPRFRLSIRQRFNPLFSGLTLKEHIDHRLVWLEGFQSPIFGADAQSLHIVGTSVGRQISFNPLFSGLTLKAGNRNSPRQRYPVSIPYFRG